MHRPNGFSDRGDLVEILKFNTPEGSYFLIVFNETKDSFPYRELHANNRHKIPSVRKINIFISNLKKTHFKQSLPTRSPLSADPFCRCRSELPFRKTVALEDRWQAGYRDNSPPPKKRRAFYVAGVREDAVGGKLLRLESAKAPIPGNSQGVATPWACFLSQSFFAGAKKD